MILIVTAKEEETLRSTLAESDLTKIIKNEVKRSLKRHINQHLVTSKFSTMEEFAKVVDEAIQRF